MQPPSHQGVKKKVSVLNKGELRKAPFLHREPGLLIQSLTPKSGRPEPLGCLPPLQALSAAFTASEYPNLFHIPGGSLRGKVIIHTVATPRFLSH